MKIYTLPVAPLNFSQQFLFQFFFFFCCHGEIFLVSCIADTDPN